MRLLIIRHGDPDYEHNDLTSAGKDEAELLVPRMKREEISEFYVSPLGRAKATARPTLEALGRTAEELEWLREFSIPILRPDKNGDYSHVPWDWLPADWLTDPRLLDREHWRENEIMAAEDIGEKYDRITTKFDELLEAHGYRRNGLLYDAVRPSKETLAFFCHFGLGCVLLSHLMNCSPMAGHVHAAEFRDDGLYRRASARHRRFPHVINGRHFAPLRRAGTADLFRTLLRNVRRRHTDRLIKKKLDAAPLLC